MSGEWDLIHKRTDLYDIFLGVWPTTVNEKFTPEEGLKLMLDSADAVSKMDLTPPKGVGMGDERAYQLVKLVKKAKEARL